MTRFYENRYISKGYVHYDKKSLIARIDTFLHDSRGLLVQSLNTVRNGHFNLYTGSVGIAMTVYRIDQGLHPKYRVDYSKLPDLNIKIHTLGEGSFENVGLASDEICAQLYHCLKEHRPFDLIPLMYKNKFSANEILTGKAGLALMIDYFVKKGLRLANPNLSKEVIHSIPIDEFPWTWHKKVHYGGAHGTAGILHAMNQVLGKESPCKDSAIVDELFAQAYIPESGNFRSSEASMKDELVQWCHGVPGFVPLLLDNYDNNLCCRDSLAPALDEIWRRGILRKGSGICHGIAGNAYCFLAAYCQLGDTEQLDRAVGFAEYILSFVESGGSPLACCETADRPLSLFEGLAGVVQYLMDLKEILIEAEAGQHNSFPIDKELFDGLGIF
jgi:hypothetical protein